MYEPYMAISKQNFSSFTASSVLELACFTVPYEVPLRSLEKPFEDLIATYNHD